MKFVKRFDAAWVPWTDGVGYGDDGQRRARAWVAHAAQDAGARRILLTGVKFWPGPTQTGWLDFLAGGYNATPRSPGPHRGPTLALRPDWRMLDEARQLARDFALCVLEYPTHAMLGWARQTGAVNLLTGEYAEPFTPEQDRALEALAAEGYKSYYDMTSQTMARHYLRELTDLGLPERTAVLGALAARALSVSALTELAKLGPSGGTRRSSRSW